MINTKNLIFIIPSFFFVSGCVSHMSQEQCQNTNWHLFGQTEGLNGQPMQNLQQKIEDCAKFGITVDQTAYSQGWTIGNKQYCSYENGYRWGLAGQEIPAVCQGLALQKLMPGWRKGSAEFCAQPNNGFTLGKSGGTYPSACNGPGYQPFQSEYERGNLVYQRINQLNSEIAAVNSNLSNKRRELRQLNDDIEYKQNQLKRDLSDPERKTKLLELNLLETKKRELLNEINRLDAKQGRLTQNVFQAQTIPQY